MPEVDELNHPRFTQVPQITQHLAISDAAYRLWVVCWGLQDSNGTVHKSLSELGKYLPRKSMKPMGKSSVLNYLKELEKCGLMSFKKGMWKTSFPDFETNTKNAEKGTSLLNEQRQPVAERTTLAAFWHRLGATVAERTTVIVRNDGYIYTFNLLNNTIKNLYSKTLSKLQKETQQTFFQNAEFSTGGEQDVDNTQAETTTRNEGENAAPFSAKTNELWPGAPCAYEEVESYFEGRFKALDMPDDPSDAAFKFMEHHGTKNGWFYQPKNRSAKYKKPIIRTTWIKHAVTWVQIAKSGIYKPKPGTHQPAKGLNGQQFPFTYQEMLSHASTHGLSREGAKWLDKHYENNGVQGPQMRWRYKGDQSTLKRKWVR